MRRSRVQKAIDCLTFPLRAVTLFQRDRFGLSCLATERYDYVAAETMGYCLDVGCGRHNRFVQVFLNGHGVGIDVYPYEGLTPDQILTDPTCFPFEDATFDTVTFIANINHIPQSLRDIELKEAYRCLKPGGRIIVTMGNPLAEVLVHWLVHFYDTVLGTNIDVDSERGMHEEEAYYLTDREITGRLTRAGFDGIRKQYFTTQWWLNHLFVAYKPD